MLNVAITGGIGSGKTVVSNIFEVLGVPVYHADSEARKFYDDPACRDQVVKALGTGILSGTDVDRKTLAALVFSNRDAMEKLNSIIHPLVLDDYQIWKSGHADKPLLMMESAIVFEAGLADLFDAIIAVYAPEEVCIRRIAERDGSAEADIRLRMNMQDDPAQKAEKADFVIYNDDKQAALPQALGVYRKLTATE